MKAMKLTWITCLGLFAGSLQAQHGKGRLHHQEPPIPETHAVAWVDAHASRGFDPVYAVRQQLPYAESEESRLQLDTVIQSIAGTHYTYSQWFQGHPIAGAQVKVSQYASGKVRIGHSLVDPSYYEVTGTPTGQSMWVAEGATLRCYRMEMSEEGELPVVSLLNEEGRPIYHWHEATMHQLETATGRVYNPDPITTAEASYSGAYVDNNDMANPFLNLERQEVSFEVTLDGSTYVLENNAVKITEHSPPTIAPATSTDGTFVYNRSESGFEDVNALYHISQYKGYLDVLGFNLVSYAIEVDCHGFNGQDQSAFTFGTNPPRLTFGTGGVDDAEDADVIVHEYGHAIMYSAAPGTNFGSQRRALDEAIGDYIAVSYSRNLKEYEWYKVFNWDGHNEFWPGRWAQSTAHYPDDLQSDLYLDAPLWSATMMQVEENIGRDETHRILFESAFSYVNGMSMAQAAQLFIEADSQLYNGVNYAYIGHIFLERGFIQEVNAPRPPDLILSVDDDVQGNRDIAVLNSLSFATGSGNLMIVNTSSEERQVALYDLSGKIVRPERMLPGLGTWSLAPETLPAGVYLLRITSGNNASPVKIVRW